MDIIPTIANRDETIAENFQKLAPLQKIRHQIRDYIWPIIYNEKNIEITEKNIRQSLNHTLKKGGKIPSRLLRRVAEKE